MSYKRYLYTIFILVFLAISGFAAIVYTVDPYGFYRPQDRAFFPIKPAMPKNQNMAKANIISKTKPKTVFIGSSRIDYTMDPSNMNQAYNAGLKGIRIAEIEPMIKHAVYNGADNILWGIDFFTFNMNVPKRADFKNDRLITSKNDSYHYGDWITLFSLSSLKPTIQTILYRGKKDISSVTIDGLTTGVDLDKKNRKKGMEKMFAEDALLYLKRLYFPVPSRQFNIGNGFTNFENSLQFLQDKKIKTTLFIPPVHVYLYTLMYQAGLFPEYNEWKKNLILTAQEYEFEIHDFSAINDITQEQIPVQKGEIMQYWWEASHFKPNLGDMIMKKVTATPIASIQTIRQFELDVINYQCANPSLVATIRDHIKKSDLENRLIPWANCQ
jgi:hypothetical protein